jgi:hypothetical protein
MKSMRNKVMTEDSEACTGSILPNPRRHGEDDAPKIYGMVKVR